MQTNPRRWKWCSSFVVTSSSVYVPVITPYFIRVIFFISISFPWLHYLQSDFLKIFLLTRFRSKRKYCKWPQIESSFREKTFAYKCSLTQSHLLNKSGESVCVFVWQHLQKMALSHSTGGRPKSKNNFGKIGVDVCSSRHFEFDGICRKIINS